MLFPDLLTSLNVPFRRHGESPHVTEGWLGLECPWCGKGSGKFGLGYNLRSNRLSCWKCGPSNLLQSLATLSGRPARELVPLLGGLARPAAPAEVRGRLELPGGLADLLPAHRNYLKGRGFDPDELVARWRLLGIGVAARLAGRIFIPIHRDGDVVSWSTRKATDRGDPTDRYRGAKREQSAVPRGLLLYGEDHVRNGVVVHEGFADVWATGPGAVCTCGVSFSRGQVRRLARYPVRVVCFDAEPAAQRRARTLAAQLEAFPGETYVAVLGAKDAACALTECPGDLRELRRYLE